MANGLRYLVAVAFGGLFPMICAAQSSTFVADHLRGNLPPHPTVIISDYKGHKLPVVGASGTSPEVEYEGKLRKLALYGVPFQPLRTAEFATGSVEIKDQRSNSMDTERVLYFGNGTQVSGGTVDKHSDYEATVVPTVSHQHCYAAVLFFDQEFMKGTADHTPITILFQQIDDLVAGKPNKVHIRFGYVDPKAHYSFFTMIFSEGLELRSNTTAFSAVFFRRLELVRHEGILTKYKAEKAGQDSPLVPYVRVRPNLPEGTDLGKLPSVVKASFMVDEDGTVYSVDVPGEINHDVRAAIHDALAGWLFLPRLKAGQATRTFVQVPIELHPAAAEPGAGPAPQGEVK